MRIGVYWNGACGLLSANFNINIYIFVYQTHVTFSVSTNKGDRTSNNYDWQHMQKVFMGIPIHIKHVFTGVPEIANGVSIEKTESPSLKRSIGTTNRSWDPNILSLIFSVRVLEWSAWSEVCQFNWIVCIYAHQSHVYISECILERTAYSAVC